MFLQICGGIQPKMIFKILFSVVSWLLFPITVIIPLIILGWITVPIAAAFKAYESYDGHDGAGTPRIQYRFTWPIMFLWDNYEDGIANDTYVKFDSMFMKIVYWSCFRNPVNNLRIVPHLSCKINPDKVRFIGNFSWKLDKYFPVRKDTNLYDTKIPQWFFAWQGFYSNFYWQFKMNNALYRFWVGWKVMPKDIYGVSTYRERGAGFAIQFKKVLDYEK